MFGKSLTRQYLIDIIKASCLKHREIYKKEVLRTHQLIKGMSDDEIERLHQSIADKYYEAVNNEVVNTIWDRNQAQSEEIVWIMATNPSKCGHRIDTTCGIRAGALYAISYHVIEGKRAKAKDCYQLSAFQYEIMLSVIEQVKHEINQ